MPKTTLDVSSTRRAMFWPEWSEADIASEKWDTVAKRKDIKKTSEQVPLFEDLEGQNAFPPGQMPFRLIRSTDFFGVKPVIKTGNRINGSEIMRQNSHLLNSKLIHSMITDIIMLWDFMKVESEKVNNTDRRPTWTPWEHIYPQNKSGDNVKSPVFNQTGKYAIKLFWLGSWRKLYVDDNLPLNQQNQLLLPVSENFGELWLLLLAKALLKVALLSADPSESFSTVHCLTGWLPHRMFLKNSPLGTWNYLNCILTTWKRGESSPQKTATDSRISDALAEKTASSPSKAKSKDSDAVKPQTIIDDSQKLLIAFGRQNRLPDRNFKNITKKDHNKIHRLFEEDFPKVLVKCTRSISLVSSSDTKPIPSWKSVRPRVDFRYAAQHPESTQENEPIQSLLLQFCIPKNTTTEEETINCIPTEKIDSAKARETEEQPSSKQPAHKPTKHHRATTANTTPTEAEIKEPPETPEPRLEECWIDVEDFCELFSSFQVFHQVQHGFSSKTLTGIQVAESNYAKSTDQLLFIDELKPIELVFCLSAVSCWPPPYVEALDTSENSATLTDSPGEAPDLKTDHLDPRAGDRRGTEGHSVVSPDLPSSSAQSRSKRTIPVAKLRVELYRCLSSNGGPPVRSLQTSGVQCFGLKLSPGRHCFRLLIEAPVAFHLQIIAYVDAVNSSSPSSGLASGPESAGGVADISVAATTTTNPTPRKNTLTMLRRGTARSSSIVPSAAGAVSMASVENRRQKSAGGSGGSRCILTTEAQLLSDLFRAPLRAGEHGAALLRVTAALFRAYNAIEGVIGELTRERPINKLRKPPAPVAQTALALEANSEALEDAVQMFEGTRKELFHTLAPDWPDSEGFSSSKIARTISNIFIEKLRDLLLRRMKSEGILPTAELNFAWRAIFRIFSGNNPFRISYQPVTDTEQNDAESSLFTFTDIQKATAAAALIQAGYRGYRTRQILATTKLSTLLAFIRSIDFHKFRGSDAGNTGRTVSTRKQSSIPVQQFGLKQASGGSLLRAIKRVCTGAMKLELLLTKSSVADGIDLLREINAAVASATKETTQNAVLLTSTTITTPLYAFLADDVCFLTHCEYSGTFRPAAWVARHRILGFMAPAEAAYDTARLGILFQETFYVPPLSGQTLICRVIFSSQAEPWQLLILDNRTSEVKCKLTGQPEEELQVFAQNDFGYTFIGLGPPTSPASASWQLQLIGDGSRGQMGLLWPVMGSSNSLRTAACCEEYAGPYEPSSNGLLFRYTLQSLYRQTVTIHARLSAAHVPLRLILRTKDRVLRLREGCGEAIIFGCHLPAYSGPDSLSASSPSISSRTSQRSAGQQVVKEPLDPAARPSRKREKTSSGRSTTSAEGRFGQRERQPEAKQPESSRINPTGLTTRRGKPQTSPTPANPVPNPPPLHGLGPAPDHGPLPSPYSLLEDSLFLEAYVDPTAWPITGANWKFLQELRNKRKEELKASFPSRPSSTNASQGDGPVIRERPTKETQKVRAVARTAVALPNIANWALRVYYDPEFSDGLSLLPQEPSASELRAYKREWEEAEPGRMERAAESRRRYLESLKTEGQWSPGLEGEKSGDSFSGKAQNTKDTDFATAASIEDLNAIAPPPADWDKEADIYVSEAKLVAFRKYPPEHAALLIDPPIQRRALAHEQIAREVIVDSSSRPSYSVRKVTRQFIDALENHVNEEITARNEEKQQQIETAVKLQLAVSKMRSEYYKNCSEYRQTTLAPTGAVGEARPAANLQPSMEAAPGYSSRMGSLARDGKQERGASRIKKIPTKS
uniref:Androglobin n=3 Tax=Schistocephalus solidus TaxID=70667 RepID=A0A0X3PPC1_SCHSO